MSYKTEVIAEVASDIRKAGFRTFIAESGEYGFYTDKEGSRVVSFEIRYLSVSISGNYSSKSCGTGWGITDDNKGEYEKYFNENPPYWATKGEKVSLTTLEEELNMYGSSNFKEVS